MKLFSKYFPYKRPDGMVEVLFALKSKADSNSAVSSIDGSFDYFEKKVKKMPKDARTEQVKILNIVNKIQKFNEQNQQRRGLKILTPNQMLSRLPISLAQLNARNNSEKLKNELKQLLYSLCR